jgi:exopolysaccharide biosynthesis polyprenyl glycosylphosphotransferase
MGPSRTLPLPQRDSLVPVGLGPQYLGFSASPALLSPSSLRRYAEIVKHRRVYRVAGPARAGLDFSNTVRLVLVGAAGDPHLGEGEVKGRGNANPRHRLRGLVDQGSSVAVAPALDASEDLPAPPLSEPEDNLETEPYALGVVAVAAAEREEPKRAAFRVQGRAGILRRALLVADTVGFTVAFVVTAVLFNPTELAHVGLDALVVVGLVGWIMLSRAFGLYERDEIWVARSTIDELPNLIALTTLGVWLGLLAANATHATRTHLGVAATFWILSTGAIAVGRGIARSLAQHRFMRTERTIILGAGRVGTRIARRLEARKEYGFEIVGFVDDDPLDLSESRPPWLGGTARLDQIVRAYGVERVIIAFSLLSTDEQVELSQRCLELGVHVDIVPRMYEVIGPRNQVHDLDGLPLLGLRSPRLSRASTTLKRSLDLVGATALLFLLAPLLLYVACRIKLESPGPVFFRQERMGAGGRRFRIFKFRTMFVDADERKQEFAHLNRHTEDGPRMFKIENDPRITPFGRSLRSWSLDELPQLFNVLRGEMSLVGPRPLILDEDEHIVGHQRRRLDLTPGITGAWQVLGRSEIPFAEMLALDYLYVTNWSLWGDVKLLARTVPIVLKRRGAY